MPASRGHDGNQRLAPLSLAMDEVVVRWSGPPRPWSLKAPDAGGRELAIASWRVAAGQQVLVHGLSGFGKTTLLHLLAGLVTPAHGRVMVGNLNLCSLSEAEKARLRREQIGLIAQSHHLLGHLTAAEHLEMGLPRTDRRLGSDRATVIAEVLTQVGLRGMGSRCVASLSGGERQRVAVARVLVARPALILADEPTASLDDHHAAIVAELLLEAAQRATLVTVSHDQRLARAFPQQVAIADLVQWRPLPRAKAATSSLAEARS